MAKRRNQKRASVQPAPEVVSFNDRIVSLSGHRGLLPALALVAAVLAWTTFDARLSIIGDNAEFITLGRALAEGRGLTYINTVEALPATKYPFGFPLILAALHLVFPFDISVMKLFVTATFILSVPLIYLVIARETSPVWALWTASLSLLSIYGLSFGSLVLSEIPYLLISLYAIWLVLEAEKRDDLRSHALAIVSLMAAYYIRSIGISLVAATVAYYLLKRRHRVAALYGGACFILALPWQIRTHLTGGPSYVRTWLLSADPYTLKGTLGFSGLVHRIIRNVISYSAEELPRVILPSFYDRHYAAFFSLGKVAPVVGAILTALFLVYLVRHLCERRLIALYLLFYGGVCLLWPEVWASVRLLIPVTPFVIFGVTHSLVHLPRKMAPGPIPIAFVALFGILYGASNVSAITFHLDRVNRQPANFKNYLLAAEWIRSNTPENAIVCCRKSYLMFVASDRRTTSYQFTEDHRTLIQDLVDRGVDHVVTDHLSGSTFRYLVPAIKANLSRFEPLHLIPDPNTYVLKFK